VRRTVRDIWSGRIGIDRHGWSIRIGSGHNWVGR
jgi:hypothetical protein